MDWLIPLLSAIGGLISGLAARRNSRLAQWLTPAQRERERATAASLEASTVTALFAEVRRLRDDLAARDKALAEQAAELARLREYRDNVARTAARMGVSVSERGSLTLDRGAAILVVDDDAGIRSVLHQFLSDEGYEVWTAGTPEEALAIAGAHRIAVAILDLYLGGGQTALALVDALRPQPTLTPTEIVVCTAAHDAASRALIARVDPVAVLPKPFELAAVAIVVRTAVAKREATAA